MYLSLSELYQYFNKAFYFKVGIEGITYAGNHGLEILHPDGSKFVHPMPTELQESVVNLLKSLQEKVKQKYLENCCYCSWYYIEVLTMINLKYVIGTEKKSSVVTNPGNFLSCVALSQQYATFLSCSSLKYFFGLIVLFLLNRLSAHSTFIMSKWSRVD